MQQTQIQIDQTECHASIQANKTLCGLAYFEEREQQDQIVRESLRYFRLMTFFKNYNYQGPADLLLIYLWVVAAHMMKTIEYEDKEIQAQRKLEEIARESIPTRPNDKKNFLGGLLKELPNETQALQSYLKGLKEMLGKQILQILYTNGVKNFESKFWIGVAKRKFMGLSYTGQ